MGRPSHKPVVRYKSFLYQAATWKAARRVVAKVEFHFGELFPRVGFIVTNLAAQNRAVVRFYNKRGTAEQWIKEGKQAVKMTRLSCHRFRANEARLWLSMIAYNLGNLCRRLVLPARVDSWSLTSLQQRLVKTGGRLIKHARNSAGKAPVSGVHANAKQNWPVAAPWKAPFGLKTGLEHCVCRPPDVGASLNQDSKWKFPFRSLRDGPHDFWVNLRESGQTVQVCRPLFLSRFHKYRNERYRYSRRDVE